MNDKNICTFPGRYEELVSFIEEFQLLRSDLWERFVQQFKEDSDYDAGWRCEYWGKMSLLCVLLFPQPEALRSADRYGEGSFERAG